MPAEGRQPPASAACGCVLVPSHPCCWLLRPCCWPSRPQPMLNALVRHAQCTACTAINAPAQTGTTTCATHRFSWRLLCCCQLQRSRWQHSSVHSLAHAAKLRNCLYSSFLRRVAVYGPGKEPGPNGRVVPCRRGYSKRGTGNYKCLLCNLRSTDYQPLIGQSGDGGTLWRNDLGRHGSE